MINGYGQGNVIRVIDADVVVRGLTLIGFGSAHPAVDAGIKLDRNTTHTLIENNVMIKNLACVHVFG